MLGHARCVATNVSELGLRKEEDDVPPRKGDVIGNGTVLAWHGTLEKLTLPHDANSVVQNKKGKTKPNRGRKPTRTNTQELCEATGSALELLV